MTKVEEMTCQELVELVTEYLEGGLHPDDVARFETHLEECEGCRTYLDQMRKTVAAAGSLSEKSLTPDMRDRLLGTFRNWKDRRIEN
jgi:predicted anti-sigma-YlaC factor YlaD